ncbi:conserved hypothetical protein [Hahella chejuensis KCTC 2396]|uniref:Phage tail fibre protein N-terminal domain-containing protein n=1 Tax=Hahella chejuensis (strain KCTC 2396) TaxID=349521 RepID=Q2SPY5_HAHCH|nr:phage tail protein [Hahella chejuensis]ABC27289.1 conserved hypothetical protein [Hahella chejuensis KCTC 2396]
MPVITLAGERLIAQKQAAGEPLTIDAFVLANVPWLDPAAPIDRHEGLPEDSRQVFSGGVTQVGYVNPNLVVYSLSLDSTQGDFAFNWIGLVSRTNDNAVVAIAHVPLQQKRKTQGSVTGNNITRNFMLEFSGAQSLTDISVSADTWQIDFTARLLGIDERERLSNQDLYGPAAFIQNGFKLVKSGSRYELQPGVGYVGGVRIEQTEPLFITVPQAPASVWVDAALVGDVSGVEARFEVIVADQIEGGPDAHGVRHYVAKLADIAQDGGVTDRRTTSAAAIQAALEAHQATPDPHPQYLRQTQYSDLKSGRKNLLINPFCAVWQTGPQVLAPIQGTYLADGWKLHRLSEFNGQFNAHLLDDKIGLALTCTATASSRALVSVAQFVEATTLQPLTYLNKTDKVSLVFKIRFSANYRGKLALAAHNHDTSILLGWKAVEVAGDASFPYQEAEIAFEFGDWHLDPKRTGAGLIVSVHFEDASDYGFSAAINHQLRLHALQLEQGHRSTDFELISLHEALAQCQRYYRALTIPYLQGWTTDKERFTVGSLWYPTMRVSPAVSLLDLSYDGGDWAQAEGISDKNCYITMQPNGSGHTAIRHGRAILDARF